MRSPVALVGMAGGTGRAVTLVGIIPPWCITPPAVHHPQLQTQAHLSTHCTKRQQPTGVTNVSGFSSQQYRQRGKWEKWKRVGAIFSFCITLGDTGFVCRGFWLCINGAGTEQGLEKQARTIDTVPPGTAQLYPPWHCYAQWEQTHTDAEHLIQTTGSP